MPYIATQHSINKGGNILRLDKVKHDVIVLMLVAFWEDPTQDTRVRELMDVIMGNVTKYTQSVGAYRPWQYLYIAYQNADTAESHGDEAVQFLKDVSLKYDPDGRYRRSLPADGSWPHTLPISNDNGRVYIKVFPLIMNAPQRRRLGFDPPLLNSANPWATTKEDLEGLYKCPHTGAVTIRTALTNGFNHNNAIHQYCFFEPKSHIVKSHSAEVHPPSPHPATIPEDPISSLNTLGYSPFSVHEYLQIINDLLLSLDLKGKPTKPVIISVAGSTAEVLDHYRSISHLQLSLNQSQKFSARLLMEINLSCPNIAGKPPPAYSREELLKYLMPLIDADPGGWGTIEVGIKTPPYTYQRQYDELISALLESSKGRCPISFITATNTLGSSLLLSKSLTPALNSSTGTGIGGLAGSALHPLALGNVVTIRRMLDAHEPLQHIEIIGVGGVSDAAGYERMRAVGAAAVGVGTALGVQGVAVFGRIWQNLEVKAEGENRPHTNYEGQLLQDLPR